MCLIVPPYDYYVYTLSYPKYSGRMGPYARIFYVGKGVGIRIYVHEEDARRGCKCHKCCVIRSIWEHGCSVDKKIVFVSSDENEACRCERELIDKIGIKNLVNKHRPPPEARHLNLSPYYE